MSGFNYCLVQVLDWEAQTSKNKKLLECNKCPLRDECEKRGNEDGRSKREHD